jgi:hypothetical protein
MRCVHWHDVGQLSVFRAEPNYLALELPYPIPEPLDLAGHPEVDTAADMAEKGFRHPC